MPFLRRFDVAPMYDPSPWWESESRLDELMEAAEPLGEYEQQPEWDTQGFAGYRDTQNPNYWRELNRFFHEVRDARDRSKVDALNATGEDWLFHE